VTPRLAVPDYAGQANATVSKIIGEDGFNMDLAFNQCLADSMIGRHRVRQALGWHQQGAVLHFLLAVSVSETSHRGFGLPWNFSVQEVDPT